MRRTNTAFAFARSKLRLAVGKLTAFDPVTKTATIQATTSYQYRWEDSLPPTVGSTIKFDTVLRNVSALPVLPRAADRHWYRVAFVTVDNDTNKVSLKTNSGRVYALSDEALAKLPSVSYGDKTWVFVHVVGHPAPGEETAVTAADLLTESLPRVPIYTEERDGSTALCCDYGTIRDSALKFTIPPGCTAAVYLDASLTLRCAATFTPSGERVGPLGPYKLHRVISVAPEGTAFTLVTKPLDALEDAATSTVRGPRRHAPFVVDSDVRVITSIHYDGSVEHIANRIPVDTPQEPSSPEAAAVPGPLVRTHRGVVKTASTIEQTDGAIVKMSPRRVAIPIGTEVEYEPKLIDGELTARNLIERPKSEGKPRLLRRSGGTRTPRGGAPPPRPPGAFTTRPPSSTAASPLQRFGGSAVKQPSPGDVIEQACVGTITSWDGSSGEVLCESIGERLVIWQPAEATRDVLRLGMKVRFDVAVDRTSDRLLAMQLTIEEIVLRDAQLTITACHPTFAAAECAGLPGQSIHVPMQLVSRNEQRVGGKITATVIAGPHGQLTCVAK